jgi:predicted RNA binding protein YcfA (HicA-like mRNA interferase family)
MPRFGPVKRSDLIRYLKELGFQGPYEGGRHQFMIRGQLKLRIPNPHGSDIGRDLLSKILR